MVAAGELIKRQVLDINRSRDIMTPKGTGQSPYEQHESENVFPVKIPRYDEGMEQWNDLTKQHMKYQRAKERSCN